MLPDTHLSHFLYNSGIGIDAIEPMILSQIACQLPLPNRANILMPQLSFDTVERLPAVIFEDSELRYQLGSQGQFTSFDETCAYNHDSTLSEPYFKKECRLPCSVNMDRGGIVTRVDSTHAACIADGVGGDGFFSAFVAQGICQDVMNTLSEKSTGFSNNEEFNKTIVKQVFHKAFQSLSKLQCCGLPGSTTILFAECVPTNQNRVYKLCVGALGDGAVIHINSREKKALQVNTIHREVDRFGIPDVSSTGGGINVREGMWDAQFIEAKVVDIDEDDYVVLVTDGFLDNVRDNKIAEMVEVIVYHPFFDRRFDALVKYNRFWETATWSRLPTVEQMKNFIGANNESGILPDKKITPEKITRRLAAYTALVTHSYRAKEEKYYANMSSFPSYDNHTPKTDDAMIIAMSPIASKK